MELKILWENGENTSNQHFLLSPQCLQKPFKSLPNDQIVEWSDFKAFPDDKIYVPEKLEFVSGRT